MSITIKGVTSGGVDLKAPDTGSNTTVTLPSATGTLLPTDGNGSALTNLTSANLVGALPALDGSSLTGVAPTKATIEALGIAASSITGALPVIDGSNLTGVGGGLQSQQVFTATGTWTKPSGITRIKVYVTGGGGGGGAGRLSSGGNNSFGASGGAGGTAIEIIDVSSVSSVTTTIGAYGSGGTASGAAGGTSSFGAYCSATGGQGGIQGGSGYADGGSGGLGSGGDINLYGGQGAPGQESYATTYLPSAKNHGGASFWGGGSRGNSRNNESSTLCYGTGGGGGSAIWINTGYEGNPGTSGVIVVEEYS